MEQREIKFRGKKIDNSEWVYGFYWKDKPFNEVRHYIRINGKESLQVHEKSVGQFVGRSDKNGQMIYEGDKVRFWTQSTRTSRKGIECVVEYENGLLLPFYDPRYTEDNQGDWFVSDSDKNHGFEVIGNIFEI